MAASFAPAGTPGPVDHQRGPDAETPATTVGEAPTEESTPIPTPPDFLFTPIPATPKFPQRKVGPINEEQLQREMLAAAFSIFGWSTNFRLRSAYYSEIMGAGPGKDYILPTDRPVFETAGEAEKCLTIREPAKVANVPGDSRAYPLQIMIWHEVANDTVGGEPVVVTYWPLCNIAFVYRRTVAGKVLDFGTTGFLRFSNLIMYQRQTESWRQEFGGESIVGDMVGTKLEQLYLSIVSWAVFKPDTIV